MFRYAGKIATIDLSKREVAEEELSTQDCFEFIGGSGMNTKILLDKMDPMTDALSESNVLCFGPGALVGTLAPASSRTSISAKSPLTGLLGSTSSGHFWGAKLKACGYDHLVLREKSPDPVYIFIDNGKVNILDAKHLWGKDSWDTIMAIRNELRNEEVEVACIGVGGEKLVKFAAVENGFGSGWARTGPGAVMGSKNVKAIALRGNKDIAVFDPKAFLDAANEATQRVVNHPAYQPWRQFGSMLAVDIYYDLGVVTGHNQSEEVSEDFIQTMGKENLLKYKKRSMACSGCPLACAPWVEIDEGPYKGLKLKGIEITPTMEFGARLGVRNLGAIAKATELFHRYGIDGTSAAVSIAFATELFEKGIISKGDTDGLELSWGDEAMIFELMRKIAYREGFGDLLADGPVEMARRIGSGSEQYLTTTRGLETNSRDPRCRWDVWNFGYLIHGRGGDHMGVQSPAENLRKSAPEGEYLWEFSPPEKAVAKVDMLDDWKEKIFDFNNGTVSIPHMAAWSQDLANIVNAAGTCIRPPVLWSLGPALHAKLLTTLTGIEFSPEDVRKAGERITNIQRIFNFKAGEKREDIKFAPKFYNVPIKGRRLEEDKVNEVLDQYYEVRNWDPKTAIPRAEKLKELNLDRFAWSRLS
jgi:aldehyde:ferredoxin oxidoreductase